MNPSNACGPHPRPAQGRWLSPDPAGLAAVNPANPQSWNAYAYVANQPLAATDPLGLCPGGCGGQQIGGGNPLTPSAQCEVEGLPDNCWLNSLATDFLCGTGQPYQQLDSSCRQFAFTGPSGGIVVGSRSARIGPLSPPARPANVAPPNCPGGPHVVFSVSAGATPGVGGGEAAASVTSGPSAASGRLGVDAVEGTPQAYAGVSFGVTGLVGPTTGTVTLGAGELGRATLTIPFTNHFPYVDGLEVGGGVVAATTPVQVAISVNGPQGVKCW